MENNYMFMCNRHKHNVMFIKTVPDLFMSRSILDLSTYIVWQVMKYYKYAMFYPYESIFMSLT